MVNEYFSNARAAARSTGLLGAERLNRMIDCTSAEDALKILQEVNFGEGLSVSAAASERLIEAEERAFSAFVREASPSENLTRFLLVQRDYRNAEAIMRSKYLKTDARAMVGTEGVYSLSLLEEKIFADDYEKFGKRLAEALSQADKMFVDGSATGRRINALFSRAHYRELSELAQNSKLLREIVSLRADAVNIGVALRARNARLASEMTVAGGTLTDAQIKCLCEESDAVIAERFCRSPRRALISCALADLAEGRPLIALEKAAKGCALSVVGREKYNDAGFRPFLLYCCKKTAELENVRIVMFCLMNGVDKAVIRSRVQDL